MAITLATFPLATLVLGPADYGAFALASAYVAIVTAFAAAAVNFSLATHLAEASAEDRVALVSTATGAAIVGAVLGGALIIGGFQALSAGIDAVSGVPRSGFMMLVFGAVLAAPWQVATGVLVLDGRAKGFAVGVVMQALCRSAALLASLFVFELGVLSLFIGSLAGSVLALAAALLVLRGDLDWQLNRRWLRIMLARAPAHGVEYISETLDTVIRNSLISSTIGFGVLGLFTHGQQYQLYTIRMFKAVTQSLWPVSLAEARDSAGNFARTIRTLRLMQLMMTLFGLFFASLGKEFISVLTHGKFADAFVFAALLMAVALIRTGAWPQFSLLIAHGRSNTHNNIQTASFVAGIALLVVLIFDFGMVGVMVAVFAQWTIAWIGRYIFARRVLAVPFSDHLVLVGTALIGGAVLCKVVLAPGFVGSLGLFVVAAAPALYVMRRDLLQVAQRFLGPLSARERLLRLLGMTAGPQGK